MHTKKSNLKAKDESATLREEKKSPKNVDGFHSKRISGEEKQRHQKPNDIISAEVHILETIL
jgi:hypothetical protein